MSTGARSFKSSITVRVLGFALSTVALFWTLPIAKAESGYRVLESAETGKGPNGAPTFSATIETTDRVTIAATGEANRLTFDVSGGLIPDKTLRFITHPKVLEGESLPKERDALREATARLLATSGQFVEPYDVIIREESDEGRVCVRFMFLGQEDPARRIDVRVQLTDARGAEIAGFHTRCKDGRVLAAEHGEVFIGGVKLTLEPLNSVIFAFKWELLKDITGIQVTFEQA